MRIEKDFDLKRLNTFGLPARAKFFVIVKDEKELHDVFSTPEFKENERLFLGGGSNILLTRDFPGLVVLNQFRGIEIVKEDENNTWIRASGGEVWHDLVLFATNLGLWGIENLAFIPGSVGAAPMQNIGAYGAELKDTLENVEAYDIKTGEKKIFQNAECFFAYRDSIFKNKLKNQYFITAITVKLSKKERKNVEYKILREYLENNKVLVKSPRDISDAVTAIRKSKLPDPKVIGNAGSFFKNIFVTKEKFNELQRKYPEIPHFEEKGEIKIPSAWLIEQAGWKGYREGDAGVHDRQALVLVNHGSARGEQLKELAGKIIASVREKFGLEISTEVNLI